MSVLFINTLLILYSLLIFVSTCNTDEKINDIKEYSASTILTPQTILVNVDLDNLYFAKTTGGCTILNCSPTRGNCIGADICRCKLGYANYNLNKSDEIILCSYEQKSQLIAFLLEFFFWIFAIGHFYAGRILFGIIKTCVMLLLPIIFRCFRSVAETGKTINLARNMSLNYSEHDKPIEVNRLMFENFETDTGFKWSELVYPLYSIGCSLWIIIDLIIFGFNGYNDGNDIPLYNW